MKDVGRLLVLAALALLGCQAPQHEPPGADSLLVHDVSGLERARVERLVHPTNADEVREAILYARDHGLRVSIAGQRHSQGGQNLLDGALLLDMTAFDEVGEVDREQGTVRVESGATWADVQEAVQPFGLAVAVMQSSNIFTVGGSLGCNAHGRDPRFGTLAETVRSLRLMDATGTVLHVSRDSNETLFGLAIGGYGLFGVILDADLELVPDVQYERHVVRLDYRDYPDYFERNVLGNEMVELQSGRLDIAPGRGFLRDMYAREYRRVADVAAPAPLRGESNVGRDRFFFDLSRRFAWGKRLRWALQLGIADVPGRVVSISRNNAMRPPIRFIEHVSRNDTDILQEYFVPVEAFVPFVDGLRDVLEAHQVNLLHAAVRYVPGGHPVVLSYAPQPAFGIVMYLNIETSSAGLVKAQRWTRELVDLCADHGGRYYLAYQGFPTPQQLRRCYPEFEEFLALKVELDPDTTFANRFYQRYAQSL